MNALPGTDDLFFFDDIGLGLKNWSNSFLNSLERLRVNFSLVNCRFGLTQIKFHIHTFTGECSKPSKGKLEKLPKMVKPPKTVN